MKLRSATSLWIIVPLVFLSFFGAVITPLTAHAGIFDDWLYLPGPDRSEGYWSNGGWSDATVSGCGYSRCPVIPNDDYARDAFNAGFYRGGNGSTPASILRANRFVDDLYGLYVMGGWDGSGAAFIVNTMLGLSSDSPGKTRNPSGAMWNDLRSRLVDRAEKGRINWNTDFSSNGLDTYTRIIKGQWDVVYDLEWEVRNGFIIYDDAGNEAYRLWYSCGNPVGAIAGVPIATPFNLVPTVTASPASVDSGGVVSLTPRIVNTNAGTSGTASWEMTTFRVPPAGALPGGGTSPRTTRPPAFYGNGAVVIAAGSGTYTSSSPSFPVPNQNVGDLPVGTRVCYTLSVNPYTRSSTDWRHSTPACVTISKTPKVQVLGGDLVVGRASKYNAAPVGGSNVVTKNSYSATTGRSYGSWSEYAIIPSGTVTNMASGAGYAGGATTSNICNLSLITISNKVGSTCPATSIGRYVDTSGVPDVASRFPVTAPSQITTPAVNINALAPKLVYTTSQATLAVSSSAAYGAGGNWVVINAPNTTVRITSNINYVGTALSKVSDIPQVVIIARNILIDDGVTNVDSWLIAVGTGSNGIINTCSSVTAGNPTSATLNANTCTNKLTVNGPILANKLYMYRTAGAGIAANTGDPSEVFNLRADAYVWASAYSPGTGRIPTVTTKELPPRF